MHKATNLFQYSNHQMDFLFLQTTNCLCRCALGYGCHLTIMTDKRIQAKGIIKLSGR